MLFWILHFILLLKTNFVKSGLLTKTGICPHATANFVVKDNRLNFYGASYILPGDENPPCNLQECVYDNDCHGNTKCCTNHCGASVCTETIREPRPCQYFSCPITKICKIQRIKCIEPICPDMYAISRPMCVNGGPYYEFTKRARIPQPKILPEEPFMNYDERETSSYLPNFSWNPQYNWYSNLVDWMSGFDRRKRSIEKN